jgi:hypothetical protein
VYVTKQGGGFGMQELTFVDLTKEMLGNDKRVPVNDMENGAVYWSNWTF